jgi:hypothetical protein
MAPFVENAAGGAETNSLKIPSHLQRISGKVHVYTNSSQAAVDELALHVHNRCPVASMIEASGCVLNVEWVKEPIHQPA